MEVPDATGALTEFLEQRDVRFVPGGVELRYSATQTLDSLATAILALPRIWLYIDGYAYSQRDSRLNQELSEHRAEAVRLYLALRGVPVEQMVARGHGSMLPLGDPVPGPRSELDRHVVFRVDEWGEGVGSRE